MGKHHKPKAVHNFMSSNENKWRDPRTGIVMAPGAVRAWPTKAEDAMIEQLYAELRAAAEAEKLLKQKKADKANEFE